jgi:dihydrofolate reductase
MTTTIIAAMGNNGVLGYKNSMPWHLPADLLHFKKITLNHAVIMGRKTFESIGKALPNRRNMVLSRQRDYTADNIEVIDSFPAAIKLFGNNKRVMIIGGATIYEQALPHCDTMILTQIHADFTGDTFFPQWNQDEWRLVSEDKHYADQQNPYDYSFLNYEKTVAEK